MTVPEPILQAVIVGTEHVEDESTISAYLQPIINQLDVALEARILLELGGKSLQKQAGYVVQQDNRPLPEPAPLDNRPVLNAAANKHLGLMLQSVTDEQRQRNFFYPNLLHEWCFHAASLELRLAEEWLPDVLQFGRNKKELRQFFLPLLGERGKWLAKKVTNQDWNWVFETEEVNLRFLVKHTNLNLEVLIIKALAEDPIDHAPHNHRGLQNLQQYKGLWSKSLARVMVGSFDLANLFDGKPIPIIRNVLNQSVYYFPLSEVNHLLKLLSNGKDEWLEIKQQLEEKFAFRQAMLDALYQSKLHVTSEQKG